MAPSFCVKLCHHGGVAKLPPILARNHHISKQIAETWPPEIWCMLQLNKREEHEDEISCTNHAEK